MTIDHYKRFLGKICTILTGPVSFPFSNPKQHAQYFSGMVKEVNQDGILIQQLEVGTMAFYTFPIVGIVEEQAVYEDDPNYEKIKKELEQKKKPTPVVQKPANFLSIEDMTKMAKQVKANRLNTHQSSSDT